MLIVITDKGYDSEISIYFVKDYYLDSVLYLDFFCTIKKKQWGTVVSIIKKAVWRIYHIYISKNVKQKIDVEMLAYNVHRMVKIEVTLMVLESHILYFFKWRK